MGSRANRRMTIWRLVAKEIAYRKLNFGLAVLSVIVAVGCLVAELTLLNMHDQRTEVRLSRLKDDYRKIMKKLGFNVLILPKDQNLADLYADDYALKLMPEEYVEKLANSRIMTVNHLLPTLQEKLTWPEQERTILLVGTRGEVPILHRDPKKPLIEAVPAGSMVVGYELHRSLKLSVGDKVKLLGREFTVSKCQKARGSKDDITIWINLKKAQDLLDKRGQINAIMALGCQCAGERLPGIRKEIASILPNTQVIEFASEAITRAEARSRAELEAKQARRELEAFAAILIPLVILGAALWIGFLAFTNARERAPEIGILRALGLRARQILLVFLAKAMIVGILGGCAGYFVGLVAGTLRGGGPQSVESSAVWFDPALFLLVLAAAPALSALASWIPAMIAAGQDPAVVLREG